MAKKLHGGRALLNLPGHHSTGAIVAEVENTATWKNGKNAHGKPMDAWNIRPDYILQISNCDRSLLFDVEISTPEDTKNALHKLDVMITTLTAFKEGLAIEAARYADRLATMDDTQREA